MTKHNILRTCCFQRLQQRLFFVDALFPSSMCKHLTVACNFGATHSAIWSFEVCNNFKDPGVQSGLTGRCTASIDGNAIQHLGRANSNDKITPIAWKLIPPRIQGQMVSMPCKSYATKKSHA
eukprot:5091629-Amphidinium_carterae.1